MANTKSNIKRIRSTKRKTARNQLIESRVTNVLKKTREALSAKDTATAPELVKKTIAELDKAVSKGILHKNNAARRKSRITKQLNALQDKKA